MTEVIGDRSGGLTYDAVLGGRMKKEPLTPIAERFIQRGSPHRTPEEWARVIEDFDRRRDAAHPKKAKTPGTPSSPDQSDWRRWLEPPDASDGAVAIVSKEEGEGNPRD